MPRKHFAWLLLLFLLSVAVRTPLLNRPLSAHHELCTALVLTVLHNWTTDGFVAHHGAPAISFSGPADLIPADYTDAPALRNGVLYYLSHPPLAFDLPQALFSATNTLPNALGLQLFNLFFHLVTTIALCLIIVELLPKEYTSVAPLFAGTLYLFMPAPLWFHGNVYMSDMFVQNAWVWHLLVVLRMYRSNSSGWKWPLLAGLTLFLTTCTSWLGVWAGMVLFGIAAFRWLRSRNAYELRIMLMAGLGVGLALGYTVWRWLQVVDAEALWAYYTGRWAVRGVTNSGGTSILAEMMINYRISWLPVLLLIPLVAFRWRFIRSPRSILFMSLAGLPVLLDHGILFQYAAHDFAALKTGVILCGLVGLALGSLRPRWALLAMVLVCSSGVWYFYRINSVGHAGLPVGEQLHTGTSIARLATPEDMVFTVGFSADPQLQWYAKRTLFQVADLEDARTLLRIKGIERGLAVSRVGDIHGMQWVHSTP